MPEQKDSIATQLHNQLSQLQNQFVLRGEVGDCLRPEIHKLMRQMHVGDIANFFETLEPDLRTIAWQNLDSELLPSVLNDMNEPAALAMVKEIPDDLLASGLREASDVEDVEGVLRSLHPKRRVLVLQKSGWDRNDQLLKSLSFAADTVGEIMDFEHCDMSPQSTVKDALVMLREKGDLPSHTDKIFITEQGKLVGVLPLKRILLNDEHTLLGDVMVRERVHTLGPEVDVDDASEVFERYDLISAPVVNHAGEVLGRVTIDEVLYYLHNEKHSDLFSSSGLKEEEDLYAPMATRMQNRGFWIFVNLIAAFLMSRLVGAFEGTILQVVALASLMPIIASMAGNIGMQTATLIIRALALNQLQLRNWHSLLGRELLLGGVNGLLWGVLVGAFGFLFYQDIVLAFVLTVSMATVFVFGAFVGFIVPITVNYLRKDPALGTVVIVTTVTDCLGFFVFLGLGAVFLV